MHKKIVFVAISLLLISGYCFAKSTISRNPFVFTEPALSLNSECIEKPALISRSIKKNQPVRCKQNKSCIAQDGSLIIRDNEGNVKIVSLPQPEE